MLTGGSLIVPIFEELFLTGSQPIQAIFRYATNHENCPSPGPSRKGRGNNTCISPLMGKEFSSRDASPLTGEAGWG